MHLFKEKRSSKPNENKMKEKQRIPKNVSPSMIQLRRCIILHLYNCFKEVPYASIELREFENICDVNVKDLNWNMVYLEKCGYIELSKSSENLGYIAVSADISAKGIDLVENIDLFNQRFPEN